MTAPGISIDRLVELHPRLYHMAAGDSWPSIHKHGLLPTTHIVGTSGLDAVQQHELLVQRRGISMVINHPVYGTVTIRDQLPLRLQFLTPKLTDVTLEQWLGVLNDRVFFWLHPDKLKGLLSARAYSRKEQDVLTLDTESLVRAHLEQVRLSPINSGSALYPNAVARGTSTFARLEDYPYAERRKGRSLADAVVELAVIGGVDDLSKHVTGVDHYIGPDFQHSILGNSQPV